MSGNLGKRCSKCRNIKPILDFSKSTRDKGNRNRGLTSWCKECVAIYHRQYHKKNLKQIKIKRTKARKKRQKDNPDLVEVKNRKRYIKHRIRMAMWKLS